MISDDAYRAPSSDEPAANATRLSKDEWRYAAKVFMGWVVGASLVRAIVTTLRVYSAASVFTVENWTGLFVTAHALYIRCVGIVLSAAYAALILIIHRRMEADLTPPQRGFFWRVLLVPPLVAPIAACVMSVFALLFMAAFLHIPIQRQAVDIFYVEGAAHGSGITFVIAFLMAVTAPDVARLVARTREWLVLKLTVATVAVLLAEHIVQSAITIAELPADWPLPWYEYIW